MDLLFPCTNLCTFYRFIISTTPVIGGLFNFYDYYRQTRGTSVFIEQFGLYSKDLGRRLNLDRFFPYTISAPSTFTSSTVRRDLQRYQRHNCLSTNRPRSDTVQCPRLPRIETLKCKSLSVTIELYPASSL